MSTNSSAVEIEHKSPIMLDTGMIARTKLLHRSQIGELFSYRCKQEVKKDTLRWIVWKDVFEYLRMYQVFDYGLDFTGEKLCNRYSMMFNQKCHPYKMYKRAFISNSSQTGCNVSSPTPALKLPKSIQLTTYNATFFIRLEIKVRILTFASFLSFATGIITILVELLKPAPAVCSSAVDQSCSVASVELRC